MAYETHETITRLWQRFLREQLAELPPEERHGLEQEFERRYAELQEGAAADSEHGFLDLIGFGSKGVLPFEDLPHRYLKPDFDDSELRGTSKTLRSSISAAAMAS